MYLEKTFANEQFLALILDGEKDDISFGSKIYNTHKSNPVESVTQLYHRANVSFITRT